MKNQPPKPNYLRFPQLSPTQPPSKLRSKTSLYEIFVRSMNSIPLWFKKSATLTRTCWLTLCWLAQISLVAQPMNSALQTPSTPSVAAMNFGKQAEINTNFYTGAAGYALPLCAVSDASVSHAVSLVYNSSNRVSEVASAIGLGWHLAGGGGLITRQILSLEDDDSSKGFYHQGNSLTNTH
ncbi:MAG: hypothetical protein AAF960_15670, partial [Bacteroidota bacterium]